MQTNRKLRVKTCFSRLWAVFNSDEISIFCPLLNNLSETKTFVKMRLFDHDIVLHTVGMGELPLNFFLYFLQSQK